MQYLHATIKDSKAKVMFNVAQIVAIVDSSPNHKGVSIFTTTDDGEFKVEESFETLLRDMPAPL